MRKDRLYFWLGLVAMAGMNVFASTTGMPWETGTTQIGTSLTKSIAPTIAIVGGAVGFLDMYRHGGSVSHIGGTAFVAGFGGLAASLWPTAMNMMGVTAALV